MRQHKKLSRDYHTSEMKALKSVSVGKVEVVDGIQNPTIKNRPGYVLVKTKYLGVCHSGKNDLSVHLLPIGLNENTLYHHSFQN